MKIKKFFLFSCFVIIGACGIGMHRVCLSFFAINSYVVDVDPSLSIVMHEKISDYIKNTDAFKTGSLSELNNEVKKKFSCVDKVTAELYAPGTVHIEIKAVKPLFNINDKLVLTRTGDSLSKDFFAQTLVARLMVINDLCVSQGSDTISLGLCQSGHQLLNPLFQRYTITWQTDQVALLCDKKEPWFTIVCSADSIPHEEVLIHCEQLKQKIATQNVKNISNARWIADVRFSNQIVVYNEKKGATYG